MSIRKILTEPDKILRQVSKPVEGVGNEEQNLMMMKFDLENEVEVIEIDSLITDSIPQDTVMVIEE